MSDGEDDGWRDFPAPEFERVFVSGWTRQADGYWWTHDDITGRDGYPCFYADALLWRPFPKAPNRPDPTRTEARR